MVQPEAAGAELLELLGQPVAAVEGLREPGVQQEAAGAELLELLVQPVAAVGGLREPGVQRDAAEELRELRLLLPRPPCRQMQPPRLLTRMPEKRD